jgi:hypothetical protein
MIDVIADRRELKATIASALRFMGATPVPRSVDAVEPRLAHEAAVQG